ncbi:MAG: SPFH domain-containing protein [Spirochaetaceae bacterium]|jgi:membrane protease subunit (stomatin/prohibitin family)|nr:SPFH domain-containing protein [Spirochaetaceae bacterium]
MAFIDVVEWSDARNDVFAWKYGQNQHNNLSTFTQLIVREAQEAVLFSKGQILGKFGPGKHTLDTENLPILRHLFGIPFGGKNPFTAEVWFVNKTAPLTIDWRTDTMRYRDPEYGEMVPLAAAGRYGLKVEDAERFLVQLVGTLTAFRAQDLTNHFLGALIAKTKSVIISFMQANMVGITTISARLDDLSRFLSEPLREFWESYGMNLTGFYITSVDVDESTADGKKIAAALGDRAAQNIAGYTWQQQQSLKLAGNAVSRGGDMGMLGVMAMSGMLGGGGMGQMMPQPAPIQQIPGQMYLPGGVLPSPGGRREVFCAKCAKKYPTTSNFCPFCGNKYNPCPRCGTDNLPTSKRCVSCGAEIAIALPGTGGFGEVCPRCGSQAQAGVKFCPTCGNKLA